MDVDGDQMEQGSPVVQQAGPAEAAATPAPGPMPANSNRSNLPGVSSLGTPGPRQAGSLGTQNGTPLPRSVAQNRGEFGQPQRRPRVQVRATSSQKTPGADADAPADALPPATDDAFDDGTYVWGTNINARHLRQSIERFIKTYRPPGSDPLAVPKYMQIIKEAIEAGELSINIDTVDMRTPVPSPADEETLVDYSSLYDTLVDFPREVHSVLDEVVRETAVYELNFEEELPRQQAMDLCLLVCRPYNLAVTKHMRDLDPSDIDKLVCIRGMVTRTSAVIPNLRYAVFECAACAHEVAVPNVGGRVEDPTQCAACKKKFSMLLNHNKGQYADKQMIKMQESPNDIPEGETPMGVTLYAHDVLVDVCRPGDRVTITGCYRAAPIRANPRQAALHALFRTYVDVVHVHRDETRRLFTQAAPGAASAQGEPSILSAPSTPGDSQGGSQGGADPLSGASQVNEEALVALENVTADELKQVKDQIKELSRDPRLVERLVASLAPNIWEMDDIKKGVLCQLFGGNSKVFPGGKIRGELNVLLVGDPSVSKSQLLTYVHKLAPRGIYTSGKGSSAVGLTAYIAKDPETREMVLESGALVLSDRGVCCIDEFDKMSDSARSMLHEAMEQQTVSVAKAGLISTLNARCSVLACANPVGSRYNPQLSIAENINLPSTLLTRFDLIYLVLDRYEETRDRRLARHLVSLFHPGSADRSRVGAAANGVAPVSPELLKKYIAYARATVQPKLSDEAADELVTRYQAMRRDGRESKVVMATPRQLESLIRISESLARMRLDERVRAADVSEAVRLWYGAMSGSASSGSDGRLDLDTLYTGATSAQRQAARALPAELRKFFQGRTTTHTLALDELLRDLNIALRKAIEAQPAQAGAYGSAAPAIDPALARGVTRSMLIDALRQMDDLVVFDEGTNTVRNIVRSRPAGASEPGPAQVPGQAAAVEVA